MTASAYCAVDLGASSGRVALGHVGEGRLSVTEVARFDNRPVRVAGTLYWDILGLYRDVLDGLRAACSRAGGMAGIGIDSWGVDYGLLSSGGDLVGNPVHYRDRRTETMMDRIGTVIEPQRLYEITGTQLAPINTLYQLAAARDGPALRSARTLLLIPDLLTYWLTGEVGTELTNASTTQLLDIRRRQWSREVVDAAGVAPTLLPPIRHPGDRVGASREFSRDGGDVPVFAVGSHDTASAVAAVPAETERFAYICSGTWSLVGVELDAPVLGERSRAANVTNELGIDGTVRYLRNVMGLWLLQECVREWEERDGSVDLDAVLHGAAREEPLRSVIDAGDAEFLAPGRMPERIAAACRRAGQPVPDTRRRLARCVLDSLALAYRSALRDIQDLCGKDIGVVHVVGGGSRNDLLCRLTADACELPVVAGPVEASTIGNLLVQARAAGALSGAIGDLRAIARDSFPLRSYQPSGSQQPWRRAARTLRP